MKIQYLISLSVIPFCNIFLSCQQIEHVDNQEYNFFRVDSSHLRNKTIKSEKGSINESYQKESDWYDETECIMLWFCFTFAYGK